MHIFRNFKGFSEVKINLFSPLTVLIGPNGSGKSNLIEGIQLLSLIAEGTPLHTISDVGQGGPEVRGGIKGCAKYGSDFFELGFSALTKYQNRDRTIEYKVSVSTLNEPRILSESLKFLDNDELVYETLEYQAAASSDIRVRYNNFARGGTKPQALVSSGKSILSQYEIFASSIKNPAAIFRLIQAVRNYLSRSFIFDPEPKLMRNYERIGNSTLYKNGSNISAVLYMLSETKEKEKEFSSIISLIKDFPDKPYENYEFVKTQLNDVIFSLVESGHKSSSKVLSDGTLRAIAVLAALETVSNYSRLVIEEFDNGLHPSRIKMIIDAVTEASKRRSVNILLTTHNPVTLNNLSNDQLKAVYCAVRRNSESDCELIPLSDLPRYEEMLSRGRLGDLVSERVLDQYFNPDFEENRKSWLLNFIDEQEKING
jgi:predicted ATPase